MSDDFDKDNFAAAVLGREIGKIIADSVSLQQQIVGILEKHIVQESKFIQIMVETLDSDYLKQQTILEFLQKGLHNK
jgi:predicted nucleotidyltransferase